MKLYTREEVERIALEVARVAEREVLRQPPEAVLNEGWFDAFEWHLRYELDHEENLDALEKSNARRAS